ncbi:hypothetical protein EDC56_1938 [Sinobacterium caligoides]|uniref:Amidohydrolase 3 domain-containing protein n=1 Tax=Sinobacterium caligoides TaxID=933926 RepID=A0A3N2DNZ9_9GAMM|nr:amidohydrolase [Sinobacterium caligoides]ROS01496.1 hypothetical protein EDC56_1938 [Sinobacterium caligoides]
MKKVALALTLFLCILIAALAWLAHPIQPPAKQVFINGNILSMNNTNATFDAVAVAGDTIVATGTNEQIKQLIDQDTVVHDLAGQTLLPGFIDAHSHFPGSGMQSLGADVNSPPIGTVTSMEQLLNNVAEQVARTPAGEWVLAFGYDDTLLSEQRHPTRKELDAISSETPIFVWHVSGHMAVVNSKALTLAGITDSSKPPLGGHYGRDSEGRLNGLIEENAVTPLQILALDFSPWQFLQMIEQANLEYLSAGVTTAQSGAVDKKMSLGMKLASLFNRTPLRLELWPIFDSYGRDLLEGNESRSSINGERVHVGAIKLFSDGSIQGFTGYLNQHYHAPYQGKKDFRGYLRFSQQKLTQQIVNFHKADMQIAVHANGDGAIDAVINAFREAQRQHPRADPRLILVHSQMATAAQLAQMKELGITPSFFSAHVYYWGDRHRDIFLGPERAARISPAKSAEDIGLRYSLHLDTPVVPMAPLLAAWSSVNRQTYGGSVLGPAERISVMSALRAITIDAAWQVFQEGNRGSIEAGKLADFVILKQNPLEHAETLNKLIVQQTIIGGVSQYKRQ